MSPNPRSRRPSNPLRTGQGKVACLLGTVVFALTPVGALASDEPPDPASAESPLAGGQMVSPEDANDQGSAQGEMEAPVTDPFAGGQTPNNTILTKDGQPCIPGAGVPLEEGIEACKAWDLSQYKSKASGKKALSWDHVYNVYACHNDYGWVNNSFGLSAALPYGDGFNECGSAPGGLRAKPAYIPGAWTPQWVGAEWIMLAPAGSSVVGFNISFNCVVGQAGTGWGATTMVGTYSQGAAYPGYQGYYCYNNSQGGTTGKFNFVEGYATWLNGQYPGFKVSFHCAFAASCSNTTAGNIEMGTRIKNVVVHMRDDTAPTISGSLYGTLFGGWHKGGNDTFYVDAADQGGGVQTVRLSIDNQQVWSQDQSCNKTLTTPCKMGWTTFWGTINSGQIADGPHTATMTVQDVGGWQTSKSSTIYIDSTAPTAPLNLQVEPDKWTATDSFQVSWDNPSQGGAAPIDGFRYKVGSAPTSPTDGTGVDVADGASTGSIAKAKAGAVGDKPIYVWLYDKAGNTTQVNVATGHLKFDDVAPNKAAPNEKNGWIGKEEADGYVQTWEPPEEPLPVSGTSGYATSLDRNENGDPGIAVTDPAEPLEKTLNINEEGSWWFHVRSISGAGIAGPIDKAELKVDLTDPGSQVSGVPGAEWVSNDVTLSLSGSDALSGINPDKPGSGTWFRVDDGSFQQGSSVVVAGDGKHTVAYHATDVAGNAEPDKSVKVGIDKTAPTVAFANSEDPDHPAQITAIAADTPSGIADVTIYYRLKGSGDPYAALPTTLSGSTAQAAFPDGELEGGTYQLKVVARDRAGNEGSSTSRQNGQPMLIEAPLRDATRIDAGFATKATKRSTRCGKRPRRGKRRKKRHARRCKASAPVFTGLAMGINAAYGKQTAIKGAIYDSFGRPIKYAPLAIYGRQDIPGAEWQQVDRLKADGQGTFGLTVPAGYSRLVRIRYDGTELRRSAVSKDLRLKVKAKATFKVRPKRLRNGHLMRFKGRVKLHPGAHLPPGGKLVALEFLDQRGGRKSWKVAGKVLRTDTAGVVKGRYRFRHVSYAQRIVFSLNVLREETFPYVPARSRKQTVVVRP